MYPAGLNGIQPRTLHWQLANQDPYTPLLFSFSVMPLDPTSHFSADMPACIVPKKQPHLLTFCRQAFTYPIQEGCRHVADGTTSNKTKPNLTIIQAKQALAAQNLGIQVFFKWGPLLQSHRLPFTPGVQTRPGKPTPPHLLSKASHPLPMAFSQTDQPVPSFFLRAYFGSGLVIQFLARRQFTPIRLKTFRIGSWLSHYSLNPCSKHTSATSLSTHRLLSLPKLRGVSCNRARNRSYLGGV